SGGPPRQQSLRRRPTTRRPTRGSKQAYSYRRALCRICEPSATGNVCGKAERTCLIDFLRCLLRFESASFNVNLSVPKDCDPAFWAISSPLHPGCIPRTHPELITTRSIR